MTATAAVLWVLAGTVFLSSPPTLAGAHSVAATLPGPLPFAQTGGSQESAKCAAINPNSSLQGTYDSIYNGLPPTNQSGGGNHSGEVGQSGYPNTTVGGQQLIEAWTTICGSPTYIQLLSQFGAGAATSGAQLNGTTGHFQAFFGLAYRANCPDQPGYECGYQTAWYVDLVNGRVSGPVTTNDGSPLGTPQTQPAGSPPQTPLVQLFRSAYSWIAIAALVVAGVIAVAVTRRRSRPEALPEDSEALGGRGSARSARTSIEASTRARPASPPEPAKPHGADESDPLSDVY